MLTEANDRAVIPGLVPVLSGCDLARVRIAVNCKGVNGSEGTHDTGSPPPASKAVAPSRRTRGEDARPRPWTAVRDLCSECHRQAKSDGIAGGGDGPYSWLRHPHPMRPTAWPGWHLCGTVGDGQSKPRTHRPPPSCVTKAMPSSQGEAQRSEPDSRGTSPKVQPSAHGGAGRKMDTGDKPRHDKP
jgi:hypothetical protein